MMRARVCPDCPATRARLLVGLVERPEGCAFRCLSVDARQPLPARWRGEYALALVRRGIVMRQRIDRAGRATAIDIVGPGSALPVAGLGDDGAAGYAVDDVMLCLVPTPTLDRALDGSDGASCTRCTSGATDATAHDVVRAHASLLERVERIAEARSRASATARVAAVMLAVADTLSPSRRLSVFPAAIQQRDLAALVALRHESVCRSLASLEADGLVARTPHGLAIVDRAGLEAL